MSLRRYDPFGDITRFRDAIDRLFEETFSQSFPTGERRNIPIDMYEEGDTLIVEADLPGMKPEDVDLQVQGDQLIINAQSQQEEKQEQQNYYHIERTARRYSRVIPLPTPVNADQAEASYENGTLRIRLPRSEEARPRRISIKGQEQQIEGQTQAGSEQGQQQQ